MIAVRNFGQVRYSEIKYSILHFVFYGITIVGLFDIGLLCGYIGLATKWLRILSIPSNDKIRNHLIANPVC